MTTTRLYISPFTPEHLKAILNPKLEAASRNITFHKIQTNPENDYGYLDLPKPDAEKLKQKLNGSILKGRKLKVEEARPMKRKRQEGGIETAVRPHKETDSVDAIEARSKKQTRRQQKDQVLRGHEISPERRIKRGWTDSHKEKSKQKSPGKTLTPSKHSDKEELLFKTQVPPNRDGTTANTTKRAKRKRGEEVVHEFENSTSHPQFLKSDSADDTNRNLQYVDGRGWVDETGAVIDPETANTDRKRTEATRVGKKTKKRKGAKPIPPPLQLDTQLSSPKKPIQEGSERTDDSSRSAGDANSPVASREVAEAVERAEPNESSVHPLEALFKKPKRPASQELVKPSLEVEGSFSFFESNEDLQDEEEAEPNMPGTPFSSQDTRNRGLRSAAPTPDTAHPSRFNSYGSIGLPGDEDLQGSEDEASTDGKEQASVTRMTRLREQSDFEKQFWEKRGENNRAWKARRRAVLKEKRQRENRASRPRTW